MIPKGYVALVLHAHLPFVRHPEYEDFLEEDWLYEAITETYIPLIQVMEGLVRDNVDFRLTMSMTPPLCSMLLDPLLQERYVRHLTKLIELTEKKSSGQSGTVRSMIWPGFTTTGFMRPELLFAMGTAAISSARSANFKNWASWKSSPAAPRTVFCH